VRELAATQLPDAPRQVFFSPSDRTDLLDAAVAAIRSARDVVLISCPFGLDPRLSEALAALDPRVLVYGLLNANQKGDLTVISRDGRIHSLFVLPAWIERLNGQSYDAGTGSGNQIHVKSLVVDPWGASPTVLIGSANFSDESVSQNDENALLLCGDRWAAAVVATEFLRVFAHYRFRDRLKALADAYDTAPLPGQAGMLLGPAEQEQPVWIVPPDAVEDAAPGAQVLGVSITDLWLDESGAWSVPYLTEGHPKRRERAVFAAEA
jgi:phosphatidylserine/phosphatidylglycerophosphate/cardiolipin synthase-like enzyme